MSVCALSKLNIKANGIFFAYFVFTERAFVRQFEQWGQELQLDTVFWREFRMTFGTCLLVLSSPLKEVLPRFKAVLPQIGQKVEKVLYVQLIPEAAKISEPFLKSPTQEPDHHVAAASALLTQLYCHSAKCQPSLDTRILLSGMKSGLSTSQNPIAALYENDLVKSDTMIQ